MSPRHRAHGVAGPRHARLSRLQQVSWIVLGLLFVAAALLSSPQFGTTEPAGTPTRDLASAQH